MNPMSTEADKTLAVPPPEPVVEDGPTEEDRLLAEESDEDDDDELLSGDVVDVGQKAIVKRNAITLAQKTGEWVKPEYEEKESRSAGVGDLYRSFVRQATAVQRLSEEEERAFGLVVRDSGQPDAIRKAAGKLVVHNLRLVIKMAHQYRRSWTNIMDLVQEASAGMAIASQRWDPDQGTRFGTYAVYWMRAQLTRFLMTNGRIIHTGNTRAGRKLYFQLPGIRRRLLADGKEPTAQAIAVEVEESVEEVERILARLDGREASLNAPVGGDDGSSLGDLIEGDISGPEESTSEKEMASLIKGLTSRYGATIENERDRALWFEHLMSTDPISLVALGKRFSVSKQRMGQLAVRLKRGFRRHVIEELGPETTLSWLFQTE
ncbi:MAG: sigma-70 family RNA polymerase sigma factor [Deltaproteobacteria bacterium]|nr:sigma-70 family RNA polymerase sigma factor [Deltaproteobacteria bacterium]